MVTTILVCGFIFAHIFDVKEGRGRTPVTAQAVDNGLDFHAPDLDVATQVRWHPPPTRIFSAGEASWTLQVEPGQRTSVSITVTPITTRRRPARSSGPSERPRP